MTHKSIVATEERAKRQTDAVLNVHVILDTTETGVMKVNT